MLIYTWEKKKQLYTLNIDIYIYRRQCDVTTKKKRYALNAGDTV